VNRGRAKFAPQAWKIIQARETKSISAGAYAIMVAGFALWLAYGLMLGQWPIILTNVVCLILAGFILVMKLLPTEKKDAVAEALDPVG
jgi:MtN3 and saliva related transmembrane protein